MPHLRPATKAQKGSMHETHTAPSAGPRGVALAPPPYGIPFIDRAVDGEGPLQLMSRPDRGHGGQEMLPPFSDDLFPSAPNHTGLPDDLKAGIESISGFDMSDVRVHFNSPQPAQLNALAYTQRTDIHLAPGQERHLPHEAWHVVQQKQARVSPTVQLKGEQINDDQNLEREATVIGERAKSWHWDGMAQQSPRHNSCSNFDREIAQNMPGTLAPHTAGTRREADSFAVLQMYKPKNNERSKIVALRNDYVELNGGDHWYGEKFDAFVKDETTTSMADIEKFVSDLANIKKPAKKAQKETPASQVMLPEKLDEVEPASSPSLPPKPIPNSAPSTAPSAKKKKKQSAKQVPKKTPAPQAPLSEKLEEEETTTPPSSILPTIAPELETTTTPSSKPKSFMEIQAEQQREVMDAQSMKNTSPSTWASKLATAVNSTSVGGSNESKSIPKAEDIGRYVSRVKAWDRQSDDGGSIHHLNASALEELCYQLDEIKSKKNKNKVFNVCLTADEEKYDRKVCLKVIAIYSDAVWQKTQHNPTYHFKITNMTQIPKSLSGWEMSKSK